jgi:hypothetical protein
MLWWFQHLPMPRSLRSVLAAAAGHYLSQHLHDNMSVGVGWGRTLRLSLSSVARRSYRKLSVVSLIGGLTQSSAVNPHETASHLADIVGGQCYYFAGPAFTDSAASRDILMNQPMLREVFERGRTVDLAFLSVGDLAHANTMTALNLITDADVKSLQAAGAVGDLCSHWINTAGEVIDHPLNFPRRGPAAGPSQGREGIHPRLRRQVQGGRHARRTGGGLCQPPVDGRGHSGATAGAQVTSGKERAGPWCKRRFSALTSAHRACASRRAAGMARCSPCRRR